MEETTIKLHDLTLEERVKLYDKLTTIAYGEKMAVYTEICDTYKIGMNKVYDWKEKLIRAFEQEETPMIVKARSTLTDAYGDIKLRWTKEDAEKTDALAQYKDAIDRVTERVRPIDEITRDTVVTYNDTCNLYLANDLHIGAFAEKETTGDRDWGIKASEGTIRKSIDYLVDNSPKSHTAIVADLGDMLEMDDFKNMTPHSGNILDVDASYSTVISVAMEAMVYMVEKALTKHELVYFYNISGNHDVSSGHSIRAFVKAWFRNNPRVIIDDSPCAIKYFKFGKTLLGFAHGDGLKMAHAGEVMAADNIEVFSETQERYFHFGHTHKDAVVDGRLCKSESHRNLAPLNAWAAHKGYRRGAGTMKCITYHENWGEISRTLFNVNMD